MSASVVQEQATVSLFTVPFENTPADMFSPWVARSLADHDPGTVEVVMGMQLQNGETVAAPGATLEGMEPSASITLPEASAQRLAVAYGALALKPHTKTNCVTLVDYVNGWSDRFEMGENEFPINQFLRYKQDKSTNVDPGDLQDGQAYVFGLQSHIVLGTSDPTRSLSKYGVAGPVVLMPNTELIKKHAAPIHATNGIA